MKEKNYGILNFNFIDNIIKKKRSEMLNILNKNKIKEYRGIVLVSCFVFGMIFTPPDVISQILLAVPMYLLFELGLLFSNEKKKKSNS